jgi:hypothetical protein
MLTDVVKKCMSDYNRTLKEKYQHHYEKNYFSIMPSNVKGRQSEEELREKLWVLQNGDRRLTNIQLSCLFYSNQVKGDAESDQIEMRKSKVKREASNINKNTSSKRESLLKPHFRIPASSAPSGGIQKKGTTKTPVIVETRRNRGRKAAAKPVAPNTQAIAHSRMNLLKALSKVKTEQVDNKEGLDKFLNERCRATMAEVGGDDIKMKYMRSDEDCSDKSSSYDGIEVESDSVRPKRRRRSPTILNSEDSSDGSNYMKNYPALPFEPPAKIDYNQEELLSLFKLITPQVAESLKLRRSERKRRKCAKNEKNDYHYGNFDLNEVSSPE